MFYDVNADGNISASDALGVINALGRGEEVGELVELLITARTTDDEAIPVDVNGRVNVAVGEVFDLEIAYDDLRTNSFGNISELGVFQLIADIAVSQPDILAPILNETQRLIIDSSVTTGAIPVERFDFSIPEAPVGISAGQLTYSSSFSAFASKKFKKQTK